MGMFGEFGAGALPLSAFNMYSNTISTSADIAPKFLTLAARGRESSLFPVS